MGGSNAHPVLELNQQRPVFRNYRLLMNGTLFISKASENDEAKFICEADNGVNEPIGKMVTLKINGMCSTLISAPCIHFRFSFRIAISNVYFYFLASPWGFLSLSSEASQCNHKLLICFPLRFVNFTFFHFLFLTNDWNSFAVFKSELFWHFFQHPRSLTWLTPGLSLAEPERLWNWCARQPGTTTSSKFRVTISRVPWA